MLNDWIMLFVLQKGNDKLLHFHRGIFVLVGHWDGCYCISCEKGPHKTKAMINYGGRCAYKSTISCGEGYQTIAWISQQLHFNGFLLLIVLMEQPVSHHKKLTKTDEATGERGEFVCVCVHVHVCVRACVCEHLCLCGHKNESAQKFHINFVFQYYNVQRVFHRESMRPSSLLNAPQG